MNGVQTTTAYGINDNGDVVGTANGGAFLYNGATTVTIPETGNSDIAYGINDANQVVGMTLSGQAFLSNNGGTPTFLEGVNANDNGLNPEQGVPGMTVSPHQVAINNSGSGFVVGEDAANGHAFKEPLSSTSSPDNWEIQALNEGSPNSLVTSAATGIDNNGDVVGYLNQNNNFNDQAELVMSGSTTPTNLGQKLNEPFSIAEAISANGNYVVGFSTTKSESSGVDQAFLYDTATDTMTRSLPTIEGGTNMKANGVNDAGWVVGQGDMNGGVWHAFVYNGSQTIDLNSLPGVQNSGWTLYNATAINDNNYIVGTGLDPSGDPEAFLLNYNAASTSPVSIIPVSISPGSLLAGVVGTAYTQAITASGGVGNSTLSIASGHLPPGMTVTQKSNELVITGTPTASGTFTFTVTATDPADPADNNSQSYTLTISPQSGPTLFQAIEGLLFDGIGLAVDMVTHQSTAGIQANIAFDMPHAGPFGQMFLDFTFMTTLNAIEQTGQLPPGV